MSDEWVKELVRRALDEDRAWNDVTTRLLVGGGLVGEACILAKDSGVISGHTCAKTAFETLDEGVVYTVLVEDGAKVRRGERVARVKGNLRAILSAERTALNFLQHLSGVATMTGAFVEKLSGRGIGVLDTRKTIPGLRVLEKEAVLHGGGVNHRMNLEEMILVKENHIEAVGGFDAMIKALGSRMEDAEIEVRTLDELMLLGANPPRRVMLDNFSPEDVARAVEIVSGWCRTGTEIEVSGGVTLENVEEYAVEGVDFISIGSLTSSARALDLSLLLEGVDRK